MRVMKDRPWQAFRLLYRYPQFGRLWVGLPSNAVTRQLKFLSQNVSVYVNFGA